MPDDADLGEDRQGERGDGHAAGGDPLPCRLLYRLTRGGAGRWTGGRRMAGLVPWRGAGFRWWHGSSELPARTRRWRYGRGGGAGAAGGVWRHGGGSAAAGRMLRHGGDAAAAGGMWRHGGGGGSAAAVAARLDALAHGVRAGADAEEHEDLAGDGGEFLGAFAQHAGAIQRLALRVVALRLAEQHGEIDLAGRHVQQHHEAVEEGKDQDLVA